MISRWDELAALDGLISRETGMALAQLAGSVAAHLAIVEIGTRCGKSACFLAEGARLGKGAHVWTVDAWSLPGNVDGWLHHADPRNREIFYRQIEAMGFPHRITQLNDFSVRAARRWTGPMIGLLFIDGDHVYKSVKADYEAWWRHLTRTAIVAFDDYGAKNSGVKQLVDEVVADVSQHPWFLDFPVPTLAVLFR